MTRTPPDRSVLLRPAARRAKLPPAAGPAPWLTLALVAAFVAGCARVAPSSPLPQPAPTGRTAPSATGRTAPAATGSNAGPALLLLAAAGDDGAVAEGAAASLVLIQLSGHSITLPLPAPSVAAVVPGVAGGLVAVLRDGRAFIAPGGPAGLATGSGWRPVALDGPGRLPPGAFVWSASASPDGRQVAAVARPGDAESPSALVVIDAGQGRREILPLADASEGVPPAWVDAAHVVIVQRDHLDRLFLALVKVGTGQVTDRLAVRALDIAASANAGTLALVTDGRVVVGPTAPILRLGQAPDTGPILPPTDLVRGGIALDADGGVLAVAVEAGDPGPSRIAVYVRDGETWRAGARITPPVSASGGWLAWLR